MLRNNCLTILSLKSVYKPNAKPASNGLSSLSLKVYLLSAPDTL